MAAKMLNAAQVLKAMTDHADHVREHKLEQRAKCVYRGRPSPRKRKAKIKRLKRHHAHLRSVAMRSAHVNPEVTS